MNRDWSQAADVVSTEIRPPASALSHPKYRADIDGLRAIAIFSVVAYHAAPEWARGGFIGVDVFFVISGFLISTIIFDNLQLDSFSFIEFYSRRIRRIFPALLIIFAACYAFGWFALFDGEYKQLGKHIAGGALFVSNFILWDESGYFDTAAAAKPFLHLWSLGVEEQFYIVWPLLLWLALKRKINWLALIVAIAALSFALNVYSARVDMVAAFYSPLTRFWELLVGALLAWAALPTARLTGMGLHVDLRCEQRLRDFASIAGAMAIGISVFLIAPNKPYPGFWALLPVGGAMLLIAVGARAWFNRIVLAHPSMVWFGLISYPLYLWHWPLLSLTQTFENEVPKGVIRLEVVIAAIALSWLTYRFIERPIRAGKEAKHMAIVLLGLMAAVAGLGYATYRTGGIQSRAIARVGRSLFNYRYFDHFQAPECFNEKGDETLFAKNGCERISFLHRKKVFLIGDSHSAYLSLGLRPYLQSRELNLFQYSTALCVPLTLHSRNERCARIYAHVRHMIETERPETVIIFARYGVYLSSPEYNEHQPLLDFIAATTFEMQRAGVKQIVVIGPMPIWDPGLPDILMRRFFLKGKTLPQRTYAGISQRSLKLDVEMKKQNFSPNTRYVSLKDFLCNEEGCLTSVGPDIKKDLIVWDSGHLTKAGAHFITENLLATMAR